MKADLVITGATIHTLDGPDVSALAVREGRIVAVGDDTARFAAREHVDGTGLVVTPGLVDSHQHPLLGIANSRGLDLMDVLDLDTLLSRLRGEASRLGPDEWVVAFAVQYNAFAATALHRDLIDEAVGGRPAFLWMIDGHTALMSTRGLALAGISGPVEFADTSRIVLDADGRPTGELHETQAVMLGQDAVPAPSVDEYVRALGDLFAAQNAVGITGVHILDLTPGIAEVLGTLDGRDALTVRTLLAPWSLPGQTADTVEALRALPGGRLWRVGAVKLFLDGAIDGGGAWLCHADDQGQNDRSIWRDPQGYGEAVRTFVDLGLPCFTHAIGDRAVATALDVYATARPRQGRHRIEHVEVMRDEDVRRFADLDVVASMQPTHMDWTQPDHSDNWSRRVGVERCGRAWRYGDIAAAGGKVALGSDWPIAPFDPRAIMAGAVLRRPVGEAGRAPHLPGQALTRRQALAGYTSLAAYGAGEESMAGRIRPGMRADLTVFGADPLTCAPDDLPDLPVAMTIVEGRVVHRL